MNTPITTHSKALADEGRLAVEELVNAKNAIIAELARITAENTRLRADTERLAKWARKYYESSAPHGHMCGLSPCLCGRNELGHALAMHQLENLT